MKFRPRKQDLVENLDKNMDLLCKAVVKAFEKLDSKMESLNIKMKSLENKVDLLHQENLSEKPRRSMCVIS